MQASFFAYRETDDENCVAAKGAMCFSCVAPAAHFLFMGNENGGKK